MSSTATQNSFSVAAKHGARLEPAVNDTHWGYTISHPGAGKIGNLLASVGGRILGALLSVVALGLWILPDSQMGPDVFAMKFAAMVMLSIFGGYTIWAGRAGLHPEYQVDQIRREVRVGHRSLRGVFVPTDSLAFSEIGSVYLLRSKDPGQYTRLFLRLGDSDVALEVARGSEDPLEALRDRLSKGISHDQHPQPAAQVVMPHLFAA